MSIAADIIVILTTTVTLAGNKIREEGKEAIESEAAIQENWNENSKQR